MIDSGASGRPGIAWFVTRVKGVLTTYTSYWVFWMVAVLVLSLQLLWRQAVDTIDAAGFLVACLLPTALVAGIVAVHAKVQFAHYRNRLLPGFAAPHLTAAMLLIAAPVVVTMTAFARVDFPLLPALSILLLAASATAWVGYWNSTGPTVVYLISAVAVFFSVIRDDAGMLPLLLLGNIPGATPLMAVTGIAAFVLLGCRVARLHEEMPEFGRVQMNGSELAYNTHLNNRTRDRALARALTSSPLNTWWLDTHFAWMVPYSSRIRSPWLRRLLLTKAATGTQAIPMFLILFAVSFGLALWLPHENRKPLPNLFIILYLPTHIGIASLIGVNLMQWRWRAAESLRPVSRSDFARTIIDANVPEVIAFWLSGIAAFALYLVLRPDVPISLSQLPLVAAVSLLTNVVAYLLASLIMSLKHAMTVTLLVSFSGVIVIGCGIGLLFFLLYQPSVWPAVFVLLGGSAAAVILYFMAWRRWYTVELV